MRVQRIGLEDHRDLALGGRKRLYIPIADGDAAGRYVFEARDDPQKRGFSATRGTDKNDELSVLDVQINVVQNLDGTKGLVQFCKFQTSHYLLPSGKLAVSTSALIFHPFGRGAVLVISTS
ncbi:hypothetical protein D3C73_503640 [compost metagenome]